MIIRICLTFQQISRAMPHQPRSTQNVPRGTSLSPEGFESHVRKAVTMLRAGSTHIAVVNSLKSVGLSFDDAKRESGFVFSEARRRLRRSQRFHRFIAWSLIVLGSVLPFATYLSSAGTLVAISAMPMLGGIGILAKLPNPKPLPTE